MSFPLFMLLGTKNPQLGWIAIGLGLAVGHAAMYGPQASFLSELFGTIVRLMEIDGEPAATSMRGCGRCRFLGAFSALAVIGTI